MRVLHICLLINIRIKGEFGTEKHVSALQYFTDRSKGVLPMWIFFVSCVCLCHTVFALLYVMFSCFVTFPCGVLVHVWYLIL